MIGLIPDKISGGHLAEFDHQLPLDAGEKISQGLRRAIVNKIIPWKKGRTRLTFSLATSFKSLGLQGQVSTIFSTQNFRSRIRKNCLPDNGHSAGPFERS